MHHTSFWEKDSYYAPKDFVIVGAGLAGLWTALEIKQHHPTASITILEKESFSLGASTRNAGFACFGSPSEMICDAAIMGEDKMWAIVNLRYKGITKLLNSFTPEEIDYDNCGGYECYTTSAEAGKINSQLTWLNKHMEEITGKAGCFSWCNGSIAKYGLSGFSSMIENSLEGGLHPGKLVQALTRKVVSLGVNILTNHALQGWEEANGMVTVRVNNAAISCTKLIIATNAWLPFLLPAAGITPARGQVIITEPIDGLALKGTFHFDEGYYYFRNVGNRILLGGARNVDIQGEATHNLSTSAIIQSELERFLATHILPGNNYKISNRWSGLMAFTPNKLPRVLQAGANVWSITGCNGMGVALTPILAEKLVQQITGSFNDPLFTSSLLLP